MGFEDICKAVQVKQFVADPAVKGFGIGILAAISPLRQLGVARQFRVFALYGCSCLTFLRLEYGTRKAPCRRAKFLSVKVDPHSWSLMKRRHEIRYVNALQVGRFPPAPFVTLASRGLLWSSTFTLPGSLLTHR
jgi:hypothetical protein